MKRTQFLKSLLLPLLAIAYPVVFFYSYNAEISEIHAVTGPLLVALSVGASVFALFLLFQRNAVSASVSAVVFIIFFYSYGALYQQLVKYNWFVVEHFLVLPVVIFIAGYAGYFITFLKPKMLATIQNVLLVVAVALVSYNVIATVPVEIRKAQARNSQKQAVQAAVAAAAPSQKYPDIYYIMLDEFAGFTPIEEFWHSDHMVEFEQYLKDHNFYVAKKSRSHEITTVLEVTSRLNLKEYPKDTPHFDLSNDLGKARAFSIAKSYGYNTIVFNPVFSNHFSVDKEIRFDDNEIGDVGVGTDKFDQMLLDQTMLSAFAKFYKAATTDAEMIRGRNMILYSLEHTPNPPGSTSPKFIYSHMLLVHAPFAFNASGGYLDPVNKYNWNYYIGLHKFAVKEIEKLVDNILLNADPDNPPVIILQSDHGARNLQLPLAGSVTLDNYPLKYQKDILYALYLPGYDYSKLTEDMDPLYTMELVFNYYLNAGVSIEKLQP